MLSLLPIPSPYSIKEYIVSLISCLVLEMRNVHIGDALLIYIFVKANSTTQVRGGNPTNPTTVVARDATPCF